MSLVWKTEKRKVKDLKLFEGNPRTISKEAAEQLLKSLKKFNLVEIPAIDQNNRVIAGNMRIVALKNLGKEEEEIDVRVPSRPLSEEEAREYLLRSNKNTGDWAWGLLKAFDENMLKDVGFTESELDNIFSITEKDEGFNEKKAIESKKNQPRYTKEGDIWVLGEHKLIVGDCTKRESWERLFGDERFEFLFTDPPYQIEGNKKGTGFGTKNATYDGVDIAGRVVDYDEWLSIASAFRSPQGSNIMVFEHWRNIVGLWLAIEKYWKVKNMVIWKKTNKHYPYLGKRVIPNKYEIMLAGGDGVVNHEEEAEFKEFLEKNDWLVESFDIAIYGSHKEAPFRNKVLMSDVIECPVSDGSDDIGSVVVYGKKRVELLIPFVKVLSRRGGIVAEAFGGSGSTIIVCEVLKRKCRAIELSPLYAEVIIERWEKFTGRKAEKAEEVKSAV